jgi:glc operon protein GlcG
LVKIGSYPVYIFAILKLVWFKQLVINMTQDVIEQMISATLLEANLLQVPITVSIVDLGGHLVAMQRMDGCSFFALDVSQKKAVTASQFKMPTHTLYELAQRVPGMEKALDKNSAILPIVGGFPVIVNEQVVGGLGISGGDADQDKAIGEKGIQALLPD